MYDSGSAAVIPNKQYWNIAPTIFQETLIMLKVIDINKIVARARKSHKILATKWIVARGDMVLVLMQILY